MAEKEERKTLQVSRYSSRRLYNTGAGEYVTVDELAQYIRDGHDICVTDKKSGEDITGQILLQIIADQEAKNGSVLPHNVLIDIVRSYAEDGKSLVPKFLSESFEVLKGHRQKVASSFFEQLSNPLDPQKAINSFEALREAQTDIAKSVIGAWMPKESRPSVNDKGMSETIDTDNNVDENMTDELKVLKEQMREMQEKLLKLEGK